MPGVRGTGLASEVRHEEDVEVREMIGGLLRLMREIGRENPVRRDLGRHRIAKSDSRGDYATEQMPQIRGASARASMGGRASRICSKPRHSGAVTSARMTRPLSTSRPTSRSPSTR